MFFNKIWCRIYNEILNLNAVSVTSSSLISKSATFRNVSINGNVNVAEHCLIQGGVKIIAESGFTLGKYSVMNGPNTNVYAALNNVEIGSFCSVAANVTFQEFTHYTDRITTHLILKHIFKQSNKDIFSKGSIVVGNDVWIGANTTVLSGITIGNGAIIGSNSLVNKDIPPYAIVAGSPAKLIRYRFDDEVIEHLEKLRWWEWSLSKILKNRFIFEETLSLEKLKKIEKIV